MTNEKKQHLHIRWGEDDEERIRKVMDAYMLNKSDAIRAAVHMVADQIKIRGYETTSKE